MEFGRSGIERTRRQAETAFDEALRNGEKMLDELRMATAALSDIPVDDLDEDVATRVHLGRAALTLAMADTAEADTDRLRRVGRLATADVVQSVDHQNALNESATQGLDEASRNGAYGHDAIAAARAAVERSFRDLDTLSADVQQRQSESESEIDTIMAKIRQIQNDV